MAFDLKISLLDLEKNPVTLNFDVDEAARSEFAARFDLMELKLFKGEATATREKGSSGSAAPGVAVRVRFKAKLVQRCGVTLEPVHDVLSESFQVRFVTGAADEVDLDPESEEDIEALEGEEINIGEIIAQYLGTAINPYPRKKGTQATDMAFARGNVTTEEQAREKTNPFSLLKKLRDRD